MLFLRLRGTLPLAVFNRCAIRSPSFVAVSCESRFAAALGKYSPTVALERSGFRAEPKQNSRRAGPCIECERLEAEFLETRDRLRNLTRLRRLTALEEKQLIDRVAMAIARMKEHEARHNFDRCKKG